MNSYAADQSEVWKAEYETEGLSCRAIGKRHSVPERLIYVVLRELGVDTGARRSERKLDRAAIAAARAAGESPKDIAARFGTTRAEVYKITRKAPVSAGDTIPAADLDGEEPNGGECLAERY